MGRALQLLTDDVAQDFKVTLDLLVRVIGAVDWPRIREGRHDTYLYLYEDFLTEYDPKLRQSSGSYYTPHEIVGPMTRLVEEVLVTRLGKLSGFADDGVYTVDPAMGTGTYLQTVLERVADLVEADEGPGAVAHRLTDVAARMAGFEIQMGPFAVAQLRTADLLADKGASPPSGGMHLYMTDTLDDPHAAQQQLASGLALIAHSRIEANKVKASQPVTVVLGNPPYGENAAGRGGWVEGGSAAHAGHSRPIMDDFRIAGDGVYAQNLKNLYVYFWRWATWKVWESTIGIDDAGIVSSSLRPDT
jgi:predicted helicase